MDLYKIKKIEVLVHIKLIYMKDNYTEKTLGQVLDKSTNIQKEEMRRFKLKTSHVDLLSH